jgi:NAD(P)-dependent dehydrogenase (short-subunit alcohol dehydrogenase family)
MKILLFGAGGTIGQAVARELGSRHQLIRVGRTGGDLQADLADGASLRAAFEKAGAIDAIACAAGNVRFKPLDQLSDDDYRFGIEDKLLGQVRLVSLGGRQLSDGGSFTLISGILNYDPIAGGASASMVNGALDGFVRAAALELPRGQRINLVSPALLDESLTKYGAFFPGHETVPGARVGRAYAKSIEGRITGQIIRVI